MPVPGGWLYQVEDVQKSRTISAEFPDYEIVRVGWSQPIFVTDRPIVAIARHDSRADDLSVTRLRDGRGGRPEGSVLRRALRRTGDALRDCWSATRRTIRKAMEALR
jgi:hypothetical protein